MSTLFCCKRMMAKCYDVDFCLTWPETYYNVLRVFLRLRESGRFVRADWVNWNLVFRYILHIRDFRQEMVTRIHTQHIEAQMTSDLRTKEAAHGDQYLERLT